MSGALAERVFVDKLHAVGLDDVEIVDRRPFGLQEAAQYPLFTAELIGVMRKLLPRRQQGRVAIAMTVTAHKRG